MVIEDGKGTLETNVYGLCLLTFTFLKKLNSRKKRSALINLSSVTGVTPMPYFTAYSASKAYVRYLTESLYEEKIENIDFMCLSPGTVTTRMTLYRKGTDACSPETMARNAFRDLGQEKETNGYWVHEIAHFMFTAMYVFCPSIFYKRMSKFSEEFLRVKLEMINSNKTY